MEHEVLDLIPQGGHFLQGVHCGLAIAGGRAGDDSNHCEAHLDVVRHRLDTLLMRAGS